MKAQYATALPQLLPLPATRVAVPDPDAPVPVLAVDDDRDILELYRLILSPRQDEGVRELDHLAEQLFGIEARRRAVPPDFLVDLAEDGRSALALVEEGGRHGRRYAVAFVDMRMPGGWDGLETIERLWQADPDIQVVICTAYSDYSWGDIVYRLGRSDRLLILRKPFESIEVLQLACALSSKWRLGLERQARIDELLAAHELLTRVIADQERMACDLEQARDAAQQAAKAKAEFLANTSHEIRTPMNGVLGMLELVLEEDGLSTYQRELLDIAFQSARSLLLVINDILDFSKIEAGKLLLELRPFEPRQLIASLQAMFGHQASEKGVALGCAVADQVPARLLGDDARLLQVLVNLVGNAIKFTPRGEVALHVVQVGCGADSALLRFSVRDTGIGIPADKFEQIFEAFSQADNSTTRRYGGTGLGLTISQRIVQLMGGRICLESEPGRGSTFFFELSFDLR